MQHQDEVMIHDEHCGCADLGAVGSLPVGGSKPGAAAEVVIKSMVRVAAQSSPSKGALVRGAALARPSLAYHTYAAAPAGHCIWLAACSVKAFGCLPELNLYFYQITKLT